VLRGVRFFLLVGGSGLGGVRAHALASACGRPVGWGPRAEGTPTQGVPSARTHLFLASEIARPPPRPEPQAARCCDRKGAVRAALGFAIDGCARTQASTAGKCSRVRRAPRM